jgi:hypothetical protein
MVQGERDTAHLEGEPVGVELGRGAARSLEADAAAADLVGIGYARELAVVDGDVVVGCAGVAPESLGHRLVTDDARRGLTLDEEGLEAVGVVDVPMGVHGRVDGRRRAGAHRRGDGRRHDRRAGVDQHQAVVGLEARHPRELRHEPGALGQLDRPTRPEEPGDLGWFTRELTELVGGVGGHGHLLGRGGR